MSAWRDVLLAFVLTCYSSIGAGAGDWGTIRIGTEGAYPPFNFVDASGKLQGFDIDIANALCAQLKAKCEFVTQDWDGIIPGLQAKRYDAIVASMSITEERKQAVAFTDKYYFVPSRFVVQKTGGPAGVSAEDLKGKTIGVQSSTTESSYVEKKYPDSTTKLYPTMDDALADLAAGRIDAVLGGALVLADWLDKADGGGSCCTLSGPELRDTAWFGEGAGIAVRKEDGDLVQLLNAALKAIVADGTYKSINDKYFKVSIY